MRLRKTTDRVLIKQAVYRAGQGMARNMGCGVLMFTQRANGLLGALALIDRS
jgi:hypothetical protein